VCPLSLGYCIVLYLVLQLFLITPLLSSNIFYDHCIIFSVDLRFLITPLVSSNISCGYCVIFSFDLRLLITHLVSSNFSTNTEYNNHFIYIYLQRCNCIRINSQWYMCYFINCGTNNYLYGIC